MTDPTAVPPARPKTTAASNELVGRRGLRCRVLVVDDSRLYREGLVQLLAAQLGESAVMAAESPVAVPVRLRGLRPDIVLLNLATSRSDLVLSAVAEVSPDARVVVIGVDDTDAPQVISCVLAGVDGYATRDYSLTDLLQVLRDVKNCGSHVPPRISSLLLAHVRESAAGRQGLSALDMLTQREIQILRLIGGGMSNQDIADELTIELHTVKNHVHSVLTKLGARRRGEAAALLNGSSMLKAADR